MSHFSDADYEAAGAKIVDAEEIWKKSDIVMKVRGREGKEWKGLCYIISSDVMYILTTTISRRVASRRGVVWWWWRDVVSSLVRSTSITHYII
jgi:NAD/NADP transhydrogenase alpha subunit